VRGDPGTPQATLTKALLGHAADSLAQRDADLASILEAHGGPPMWSRRPGFSTLVRIVLEQQVSLASARAAYGRLRAALPRMTPHRFLELSDSRLKGIGFSRQKAHYCRHLARSMVAGELRLTRLTHLPDDDAKSELLKIKGIGPWTADIYLLMALRRVDIWPAGDLALAKAAQRLKRLDACPDPEELNDIGASWRPFRAVAARMLWQYYLADFAL